MGSQAPIHTQTTKTGHLSGTVTPLLYPTSTDIKTNYSHVRKHFLISSNTFHTALSTLWLRQTNTTTKHYNSNQIWTHCISIQKPEGCCCSNQSTVRGLQRARGFVNNMHVVGQGARLLHSCSCRVHRHA